MTLRFEPRSDEPFHVTGHRERHGRRLKASAGAPAAACDQIENRAKARQITNEKKGTLWTTAHVLGSPSSYASRAVPSKDNGSGSVHGAPSTSGVSDYINWRLSRGLARHPDRPHPAGAG